MKGPLRLLFVSHSFPPPDRPQTNIGGMQRVATELYAALSRHPGVVLTPLILKTSWRWTHWRTPFFLARVAYQLRRMARRKNVDAVLFSSMVTASMALPAGRKLHRKGIPLAAIVHGRDVTLPFKPYQVLVPRIFTALDAVLPVSRATGEACTERSLPSEKVHVVPNGIEVRRFEMDLTPEEAFRQLAGPEATRPELLLCSVGRQVPRKGFSWFVENVMPRLPEGVHYWLAGEGPEARAIEEAAARAGVAGRVRLLGRLSDHDLHLLYRAAGLFVMPNIPVPGDMEGFGVVMLEAGLSGLPTIGADLEGIRDVIQDGKNGHLVPTRDTDGFVERILQYIDANERARFSRRAERFVRNTFSWDAVADRYVSELRALVNARQKA